MLKACEKEFGNPSTPQCSCKIPFRIDGVSFCADSNGEIIRLSFFASRKAETKKKEDRVQRLLRKLRKMRFPPFDRRDIPKARRDSMYINYTALRLKNNVSREDYKFPYPNSSNTSTHLRWTGEGLRPWATSTDTHLRPLPAPHREHSRVCLSSNHKITKPITTNK